MFEFQIEPIHADWSNGSAMEFLVGDVNALIQRSYQDTFDFYQRQFGVYAFMSITRDKTFKLHYISGSSLLIQSHDSCAWTPNGTMTMKNKELTPTRLKINIEQCYDELFDSAFDAYYEYATGDLVQYSEVGMRWIQEMLNFVAAAATLSLRATLTGGQLFPADVALRANTDTSVEVGFRRQMASMKGWMRLVLDLATEPGMSYLNSNVLTQADIATGGRQIKDTVSILDKYDAIRASAPRELNRALTIQGVTGVDVMVPIVLCSYSVIERLARERDEIAQNVQLEDSRITRQTFTTDTPRGQRTISVFFIDETAFIPVDSLGVYTQHMEFEPHFMFATMSGVIQMGGSFQAVPIPGTANVGLRVEIGQGIRDAGMYRVGAHMLAAVAINSTKYLAGSYVLSPTTNA